MHPTAYLIPELLSKSLDRVLPWSPALAVWCRRRGMVGRVVTPVRPALVRRHTAGQTLDLWDVRCGGCGGVRVVATSHADGEGRCGTCGAAYRVVVGTRGKTLYLVECVEAVGAR